MLSPGWGVYGYRGAGSQAERLRRGGTRGRVKAAIQLERVRTRKAPCDAEERVNGEVLQITVLI